MAYEEMLLDIESEVATVTLNRPEKLNALNGRLRDEILEVCHEIKHNDGIRVAIFTGAGRGFCSGADLTGGMPQSDAAPKWQVTTDEDGWVGRQAHAVYQLDKPSIAAVNGVAAGAGMSLALACDMRIGSENARFKTVFIERNLSPDSGMSYFLPRIVGQGNAMNMILTSRAVGAEEALRMGLLQSLVAHDELLAAAKETAAQIAAHPPIAAIMSKRVVQRSMDHTFDDQMRYESAALGICRRATNDAKEQRNAFLEKRSARYTGT